MKKLNEKNKLCLECLECCKKVSLPIIVPENFDINKNFYLFEEWAAVREIEIIETVDNIIWMAVPYPCQHLTENGCKIYDYRPIICRMYDARKDPAARKKCLWNKIK